MTAVINEQAVSTTTEGSVNDRYGVRSSLVVLIADYYVAYPARKATISDVPTTYDSIARSCQCGLRLKEIFSSHGVPSHMQEREFRLAMVEYRE